MLLATPAIVLHTTNYSETSVIAKLFTRQLGVRSYILKGVRKSNGRVKQNLLQPMSYLDLVVYNNPKRQINYLKEVAPHHGTAQPVPPTNNDEMAQHALRFFKTELLYKTLREEEPMPELFDYVADTMEKESGMSAAHVPVSFMLSVSKHLGIEPMDNYSVREPLFDMASGRFAATGESTMDASSSRLLHGYLQSVHHGVAAPQAPLQQRTELINNMIKYYQMHLSDFKGFRSHEILHSVLGG